MLEIIKSQNLNVMRTRIFSFMLVVIISFSPTFVFGHSGHGTFDGLNIGHYLTSPLHVISALVVLGVTVLGVSYFKRRQAN